MRTVVASQPVTRPALLRASWWMLAFGALIAGFLVYAPSLHGDLVFDDRTLPMLYANAASLPLRAWVGVRPLLMATYYLNFHLGGLDTLGYHVVNVMLHALNSVLVFYVLRRILEMARVEAVQRQFVALFCSALFLLHPVQTEAVSYIASRSEDLSVALFLAALAVFLYRRQTAITFKTAAVVLILYALAMSSKEHTAMLPAVLLLIDYTWNPGFSFSGIKRNWKLYVPIVILGAAGAQFILRHIGAGSNIGAGETGVSWYQYLFTEFRAISVYLRLFILPYGQNVDYNFPVSRTLLDHGALYYGIALAAVSVAAFLFRKLYPLFFCGWFAALLLLAPTSSVLPIKDTLADRRMYLPFIGFLLVASQFLLRIQWQRRMALACAAAVLLVFGLFTWQRNGTWVNMESLWQDSVRKDPENPRALLGLGDAFALRNHCAEAIPYFERARRFEYSYHVMYNLASARDCANQIPAAITGYQDAIGIKPTAEAWAHLAFLDMRTYKFKDAHVALDNAQRLDPAFVLTYDYRGILDLAESNFDDAAAQFGNALRLDPSDATAPRGLERAQHHERQY